MFEAYIAAAVAMVIFGIPAALQQHAYSPISKDAAPGIHIDWTRLGVVALILGAAIAANVIINTRYAQLSDSFPSRSIMQTSSNFSPESSGSF